MHASCSEPPHNGCCFSQHRVLFSTLLGSAASAPPGLQPCPSRCGAQHCSDGIGIYILVYCHHTCPGCMPCCCLSLRGAADTRALAPHSLSQLYVGNIAWATQVRFICACERFAADAVAMSGMLCMDHTLTPAPASSPHRSPTCRSCLANMARLRMPSSPPTARPAGASRLHIFGSSCCQQLVGSAAS
jgi:hypothetical protein